MKRSKELYVLRKDVNKCNFTSEICIQICKVSDSWTSASPLVSHFNNVNKMISNYTIYQWQGLTLKTQEIKPKVLRNNIVLGKNITMALHTFHDKTLWEKVWKYFHYIVNPQ